MSDSTSASVVQVSALQMAWLRELGIEKPWLPQQVPTVSVKTEKQPTARLAGSEPAAVVASSVVKIKPAQITSPKVAVAAPEAQVNVAGLINLDSLASEVSACKSCGLCSERERVVVGEGVLNPAIMIIGEAPGEQEDRQGKPFVGRSGQLLDNMLRAIGRNRNSDVYITNIIKCRPPGNRNPRPDEIAACRPFLARQIELVQPQRLLLLGRFAASALLNDHSALHVLRGKSFTYSCAGKSIPVVVSYHPAYLLRRPEEKAAAWLDLQAFL